MKRPSTLSVTNTSISAVIALTVAFTLVTAVGTSREAAAQTQTLQLAQSQLTEKERDNAERRAQEAALVSRVSELSKSVKAKAGFDKVAADAEATIARAEAIGSLGAEPSALAKKVNTARETVERTESPAVVVDQTKKLTEASEALSGRIAAVAAETATVVVPEPTIAPVPVDTAPAPASGPQIEPAPVVPAVVVSEPVQEAAPVEVAPAPVVPEPVAAPAPVGNEAILAQYRAVLDSVGGSWVSLVWRDGTAAASAPGVIYIGESIWGEPYWAMRHELAHQYQFSVGYNALLANAGYQSAYGGDIEALANCMAGVMGSPSAGDCGGERGSVASAILGGHLP